MKNDTCDKIFVAFDLETTGFDKDRNGIIEIGILRYTFDSKGELVRLKEYSQLIDPQQPIPPEVQTITGISDEMVLGQPLIKNVLTEVKEMFEGADYILGHNVNFDISFLSKFVDLTAPALDSQFFAETFIPGLTSYSLDVIPFEASIDRGAAHRAFDDSVVSAEVFLLALRQFASLPNYQNEIIHAYSKAKLIEAEVLELAREIIKPTKLFTPTIDDSSLVYSESEEMIAGIAEAISEDSRVVINHTSAHNSFYSIAKGITSNASKSEGPYLLAFHSKLQAHSLPDGKYIGNPERLICSQRLHRAFSKDSYSRSEATLLVKLVVSETLNPDYNFFPKLESQERSYLTQYQAYPETCSDHDCKYKEKLELLSQKDALLTFTHDDFWMINKKLLASAGFTAVIDYDDASDSLGSRREIRQHINSIPDFLRTAPGLGELSKSSVINQLALNFLGKESSYGEALALAVDNAVAKNDLFWALLAMSYKHYLDNETSVHITPAMQLDLEFKRIRQAAEAVIDALENVSQELDIERDAQTKAFSINLAEQISKWHSFVEPDNYFCLLEVMPNKVQLTLKPRPEFIQKEFHARLAPKTLLTAATGSPSLNSHYNKLLEIEDWPIKIIDVPYKQNAKLKIVTGRQGTVETIVKIALEHPDSRIVVVAKNLKEARLTADHLSSNLGEDRRVLALDSSGSGANKVVHAFSREENGILCVPPRGRVLNAPWPRFDVAILTSIPFPAPEPHTGFMDSTFPRAMLAQKALLAKILNAGDPELNIYLTDSRLVKNDYGKSFVRLAEELCGAKYETKEF